MNGSEALLRSERKHGRLDSTAICYVENWLAGEDRDEGGHPFETGEGLALNEVAPNRPVRLRISKGANKDPEMSMLDKMRVEVGRASSTHSLGFVAFMSGTVFEALRRATRRSEEGVGAADRRARRDGREETPC